MKTKCLLLILFILASIYVNGQAEDWIIEGEQLNKDGQFNESLVPFLQAYQFYTKENNAKGITRAALGLGYTYINIHQVPKSISYYKTAYSLAKENKWLEQEKEAADALSSMLFLTGQPQEAIPYAKRCIELGLALNDEVFYSTKLMELGYLHFQVGSLDSADLYLHKALELKQDMGDEGGTVFVQNYLGEFYKSIGDLEKAQDLNFLNLNYWEAQKDSVKLITTYFNIANIFFEMEDYEKSETYARKSLELSEQLNLVIYKSFGLKRLAAINIINGEIDHALSKYLQLIDIYKITDHKTRMADVLMNVATLHLDQSELTEAQNYLDQAVVYVEQTEDIRTKINLQLVQSKISKKEQNFNSALKEALIAYEYSSKAGFQFEKAESSLLISEAYSGLNMASKALSWHKSYSQLKDSLNQESQQNSIHELETKYRVSQKQDEIQKLNTEKELVDLRLESASRNQIILVFGIILLALIAALSYFFYSTKKKDNTLLEEKNEIIERSLEEKELLVQEIHHRVKNNLQTISSLLNMQSFNTENPEALAAIKKGEDRIKSMTYIHESLFKTEDGLNLNASDYIEKLAWGLFDSYNIRPEKISLKLKVEEVKLDLDKMIGLGLILNELISNALKHAFPQSNNGVITVKLTNKKDEINLHVSDNGIGLPKDYGDKNSLGFQIVRDFVKKLNGELIVNNNSGTDINITIPRT